MAKDQLRDLHLFALESALPFGMGVIKNARKGGLKKILNVLKSKDPFSEFQVAGENSAKIVRGKIDQFIPGLGHPVVSVEVSVDENYPEYKNNDRDSLVSTLNRIDNRLDKLKYFVNNDFQNIADE
tara:strand:- start:383 stop:760 length:378 start_codon:yes stop_codon:yes gene_type:complete